MTVLRWAVRAHKWLALLIGLQVFLWLLGGLVMSALPIEKVRGETKIASHPAPAMDVAELITLERALAVAGLRSLDVAVLTTLIGEPVWRLRSGESTIVVSAIDARRMTPVDGAFAWAIADHDFAPDVPVRSVMLLEDPPSEYGPGGPVWQVRFDDAGDTRLYVDPESGEVRARRSSTWRVFDFFWRLHVMDYDDGEDFNHPLLIGAALLGVLVAVAGLVILSFRIRRVTAVLGKRSLAKR
jgi:uncharacterized iron-regulated membrane protein